MFSRLSKQLSTSGRFFATQAAAAGDANATKIFAAYSVYKGKAALSASPRLPTFAKVGTGGALKVDRKGSIMLTFWPAIAERKYDWEKKQHFALSATEVGSLINLGPHDSCEFFHDPAMLSSNSGQVRKTLGIKALNDGSGYFFSLNVVNNIMQTNDRLVVPVTSAEFAVMKIAFSFALPRILGWDQYDNQALGAGATNTSSSKVLPHLMDSEWEK